VCAGKVPNRWGQEGSGEKTAAWFMAVVAAVHVRRWRPRHGGQGAGQWRVRACGGGGVRASRVRGSAGALWCEVGARLWEVEGCMEGIPASFRPRSPDATGSRNAPERRSTPAGVPFARPGLRADNRKVVRYSGGEQRQGRWCQRYGAAGAGVSGGMRRWWRKFLLCRVLGSEKGEG